MKVTKRILSLLQVFAMLFALAACNDQPGETTGTPGTTGGNASADKATYTVQLETAGGMVLSGYQVMVYADEACQDMVDMGTTDNKGSVSWSLKKDGKYYFKLDDTQLKGFDVQDVYAFSNKTVKVTLTSSLIQGENPASKVFKVGDVMYDFSYEDNSKVICADCGVVNDSYETVVTVDENGEEQSSYIRRTKCAECEAAVDWDKAQFPKITLSEVLAEKDMVMLNFWYTTCSNCITEFPVLNNAYNMFSEDVAVLGVNSYSPDSMSMVVDFEAQYQLFLDFPLGKVDNNFNVEKFIDPLDKQPSEGYPTSVFIDRYGMICLIVEGSIESLTQWTSIFNHFVGDDYEQKLIENGDDLITRMEAQPPKNTLEEIAGAFNGEADLDVTYRWEADDIYSWAYEVGEKDGTTCIYPSNSQIYESYAIVYADVTMKKGDVLAFDYWASCEANNDVLYVIVNNEPIYNLTGLKNGWQSAYCWIAEEDGVYELALCYQKDSDVDAGDDRVYLKNLRTVTIADIDTPSYLPRQAATLQADGSYKYVDLVLNEKDGYYHVGSADGPLLLAGLIDFTQFNEEEYVFKWALDEELVLDEHDYYNDMVSYFSAATNSNLPGWCTVTEELAEYLKIVAQIKGFSGEENEWMLLCKYYDAYGTNGVQLEDPVAGLKKWSALTALEGVGIETNVLSYNGTPLLPRGKLARFTPSKSGVYRISSTSDYPDTTEAWIFVDNQENPIYTYQNDEKLSYLYCDERNVTMVIYMEAGKNYYIDIATYDLYAVANIWYDIEFLGETYELFRSCSPGPFTFIEGGDYSHAISIGIPVVLNPEDGYYHEDLGKDAQGNQIYGSIIYAYFTGGTVSFGDPIADIPVYNADGTPKLDENGEPVVRKGMISMGGFDFGYSEEDLEILAYLKMHDGDVNATDAYLQKLWGSDYAKNMIDYKVEDVFMGIYHGDGDDGSQIMLSYVEKIIDDGADQPLTGCVPVDAKLAQMLQKLMDKYTFKDVENSWLKCCFYFDHLGPQN